jgi:hypothetical protein
MQLMRPGALLLALLFFVISHSGFAQTLLHYWNFNNSTTEQALLTPTVALVGGASIVHNAGPNGAGANSEIQITSNTTGQGFEITNPNARNGDVAGAHLRFNNPIGGNLVFSLPTTGFTNVIVKYGTRRSGQGAWNQVIDYSLDGTTFTNLTTVQPVDGNPTLVTLDFSAKAGAANNPNFKIRISFTQGGGGVAGNNRFDNFTLDADPVPYTPALIHYWNFNNATSLNALITPNVALVPGSGIEQMANGTIATIDWQNGTGQGFDLQNLNARNGDAAGTHLRYNNPIGGQLIFSLPTTGSIENVVKYVARRSSSGAGTQLVEYTTDGTTYKTVTSITVTETPTLITLNFTDSAGVSNNPNFKLRFSFQQGGGGTVGNNRFDNFTLDGKIALVDNNPPSVVFSPANNATAVNVNVQPTLTFNRPIRLIDNSPVTNDNVAGLLELRQGGPAGAPVNFTATISGQVITFVPQAPLAAGQPYYVALKANTVEGENDVAIAGVQSATFTTQATSFVSFAATPTFYSVSEADGSVLVSLAIQNPVVGSFRIVLKPAPWSNASPSSDFIFASTTIQTTPNTPASLAVAIPIINDTEAELDEYFVLALEELNNYAPTGRQLLTVYIRDNDRRAPLPTEEIRLKLVGSYDPSPIAGSTTEVVAYDAASKRLFMTSAVQDRLDIASFANPGNITLIKSIDMSPYGGITSVAVRNGMVAVASPNAQEELNGTVVFFNVDGDFQKQVTVGALPDMITFSPDGKMVLTANEGQPNNAYTIDPEGSVSIIDVSGGMASIDQSKVTTMLFTQFNAQEAQLIAAGVRKTKASSTLSQDLEPEYITFSPDGSKAWVGLQENNSMAEIDLATKAFTRIWGLGLKDFSTAAGGGLDASDNSGVVHISNWPVKSFYMPDAMGSFTAGGKSYIVTANEGDEKEYAGLNERTTVGAVNLDPVKYPHAAMLKETFNIGRFRITNINGDTDGDGDYDELINIGARSFSIWDAETGALVYDSKDEIELFTATHPQFSAIFNADHGSNTRKGRSNSKGPEPEGLIVATINGQTYAFVALERIGGLLVYNITNPADVKLVDYENSRTMNALGGDLGAETVTYISAAESPDNKHYAIVANEISGTLSIFEIETGASLPVNLLSFEANATGKKLVQLVWATASERNNAFFTIERSSDGRNYSKLTTVNTKGDSDFGYTYTTTDNAPLAGKNYYRLSQTDKNGSTTFARIRLVNMGNLTPAFTVYPNPVPGNRVQVQLKSGKQGSTALRLFDMQGKTVYTTNRILAGNNLVIDLPVRPPSGTYMLYIEGIGTQQIVF